MSDVKYLMNDEAVCPYCDHEQSDSWEIATETRDEWIQTECGNCGNTFLLERVVQVSYSTERADCANDLVEHQWKNRVSAPRDWSVGKQQCRICFSDREIEVDEWQNIEADHSHPQNWRTS